MEILKRIDISSKKDADLLDDHASVNSRAARTNFRRLINTARIDKETVIITDHGEPAAAVIPISDLRKLDKLNTLNSRDKIGSLDFKSMSAQELREFILGPEKLVDDEHVGDHNVSSTKTPKRSFRKRKR